VLVLVLVVGRGGHVNTFRAWATVKQSKARDEEINTPRGSLHFFRCRRKLISRRFFDNRIGFSRYEDYEE